VLQILDEKNKDNKNGTTRRSKSDTFWRKRHTADIRKRVYHFEIEYQEFRQKGSRDDNGHFKFLRMQLKFEKTLS